MGDTVIHARSARLLGRLSRALRAVFAPAPFEPDQLLPAATDPIPKRHHDALAVLGAARAAVQRGWVQNAWYVMQAPDRTRRTLAPTCLVGVDHSQVVQTCLVGAVLHAAWQQSSRPEHAYPAIDALWQALYGTGDPAGGGPAGGDPVGPVCPPPVRMARVRDLTAWNDARDRTKDDVLRLLDRTTGRIR